MSEDQRKIVRSGTFSLFTIYSTFLLSLLNTILMARLLSPENWGILLFALTVISTASFFCTFFPPGVEGTLQYYVPLFKQDKDDNSLRNFIFHAYKTRLCLMIFVFIIFHLIIYFLNLNMLITQSLIIISPMIIIAVLQNLNNSLLLAFQKFKKVFIINFLNPIIYVIGNLIIYLEGLNNPLILIAFIYVFSSSISCFFSIIYIIRVIPRKRTGSTKSTSSIQNIKYRDIHTKYGLYLTLSGITSNVIGFITTSLFLVFGVIAYITFLTICYTFIEFAENFSGSAKGSFTSIFSEIKIKKGSHEFKTLIYQINKYLLFSVSLIVGILFFFMEIIIVLIYTEIYLFVILGIQLFLISAFPRVITRNLLIISHSTNRTKLNFYLKVFQSFGNLIVTIIALIFFGFYTLVLLYFIIILIEPIIGIYLINRKSDLKFSYYLFFKPFLLFLLSFMLIFPLIFFFNFNLFPSIFIINSFLNGFLKTIIFFFVFYLIIYFTKYITKEEFNQFIKVIPILRMDRPFIQKITKLLEKVLPHEKKY